MLSVPDYRVSDPAHIAKMVEAWNFATLIHATLPDDVETTPVPVFVVDRPDPAAPADLTAPTAPTERAGLAPAPSLVLECHLARANPLVARLAAVPQISVLVTGPHGYITPDWYETVVAVPTWNYAAVHLQGTARLWEDRERLLALLDRTAGVHEPTVGGGWARRPENAAYVTRLLPGIVGLDITVTRAEAKLKMSQDKPPSTVARVIAGLEALGTRAELVSLMRQVHGLGAGGATAADRASGTETTPESRDGTAPTA